MRIIGVDPGKTTGICSFYIDEQNPVPELIYSYELDFRGVGQFFEHQLGSFDTTVVCESFIITPQTAKNSQAPWSLEVIGIVRYFCHKANVPFLMHAPSSHKRLITNDVLKRAGLYVQGDHARDAARIALYTVVTELKLMQGSLKEVPSESAAD